MYEQIATLHQQVREFVEKENQDYRVTSVRGYSEATYEQPLHGLTEDPDFILSYTSLRFQVEAEYLFTYGLSLEVALLDNEQFMITSRTVTRPASPLFEKKRK